MQNTCNVCCLWCDSPVCDICFSFLNFNRADCGIMRTLNWVESFDREVLYEQFWEVLCKVSATISWTIHHILPDTALIDLCQTISTSKVSHSKQARTEVLLMRSVKLAIPNQWSLSSLSPNAWATSHASSHARMLTCFAFKIPHRFSKKRENACSLVCHIKIVT